MRMSTLQLAMIAAGVVLVLAVIAYNVWQERRVRRRIASAFNPPRAAASDAERARRVEPTLGTRDDAPGAAADTHAAAREAIEPPSAAFAIPMDDVTVAGGGEAAAVDDGTAAAVDQGTAAADDEPGHA